jgi:AcrR family transcriptional regulator
LVESTRSDARRNRDTLLAVAAEAFARNDGPVSLEGIARAAGVGIGTLYRHFPNREALVEAVYRAELAEVSASAQAMIDRYPPVEALRRWMNRYAEFVAAKKGMAESLRAILATGAIEPTDTRASIIAAMDTLLRAGAADGSLRSDVDADDVVTTLLGILLTSRSTEQAQRMLDLLVDGVVTTR